MRLTALLVAAVLAAGVLWLAGEQHRKNCISSGHSGCSVPPWNSGERAARDVPEQGAPEKRMTRDACELLNARKAAAGTPTADLYDCSKSPVR
jgi:hypothetical protein